ncbi:Dyp-type peroxidase [Streptomyces luteocolor]|uniref:Dyp-type peroxidase n=1 Tax=Streptomyces luteocolor TaxID=285500 RepID=UPI000853C4DF|nr:Dyp-type peroxidase [Streptomyces luteocolor]
MTSPPPPSRRFLLTATTVALAGASGCASRSAGRDDERPQRGTQAGVSEAQPRHVLMAAFDVQGSGRERAAGNGVRRALSEWSSRPPRGVTVTVAAGPGLYRKLRLPAPEGLRDLPAFPGDRLEARRSGGDLLVQLCADDPLACRRALTRLTAQARDALGLRWRQSGFLPPHDAHETPRNLFGFKDGTENPPQGELPRWVWNDSGGTHLVYRRIHMDVDRFTALPTGRQEEVIGRHRASGAPLGSRTERDAVDLYAKSPRGRYVIPADAHVRLAHSRLDGGARMLRRGYSYDDGHDDKGLLFLAYMRDPQLFVRVQQRLASEDAMSAFTEHRASAVGYVLPAPGPGERLGDLLA